MQFYSYTIDEKEKDTYAFARAEDSGASYKDLTQVCGRLRGKKIAWAFDFLAKVSEGSIPVLYRKFNTKLGHRRELRGRKGRYPEKAAREVLVLLKSVEANAKVKGLSDDLTVVHISANKKASFPRGMSKGRRGRSDYETSRIEIVVKGPRLVEKKIEVRAPQKVEAPKEETAPHTHEHKDDSKQQVKSAEVTKPSQEKKPETANTQPISSTTKKVTLPKKEDSKHEPESKKVALSKVKKEKKEEHHALR